MKLTKIIMGLPITVEIVDKDATIEALDKIFTYFTKIDQTFSTYKETSEITRINQGKLSVTDASKDVQIIFELSEQTKKETHGYFDIRRNGEYDPSGIVKGWAIYNASLLLQQEKFTNYYIEAGGDIQVKGSNSEGKKWRIGIKNPFKHEELVKIIYLETEGVATSGTYLRGQHIYNPLDKTQKIHDIVSLTVIGPNVYEADRFATAAFAMGKKGIEFIEKFKGFEGYVIDCHGVATMTSGFERYTI